MEVSMEKKQIQVRHSTFYYSILFKEKCNNFILELISGFKKSNYFLNKLLDVVPYVRRELNGLEKNGSVVSNGF